VVASALVSTLATAVFALAPSPALAIPALILLGGALAGIFPAVLGFASARYPAHSGTVFGILFTLALGGGMTLPWLTGQVAAAWGLRVALGLVALQFLAVLALQLVTTARAGRASAAGR
jgi:fucose permease